MKNYEKDMKNCEKCDFWIRVGKEDVAGDCRRHTPVPSLMQGMNPITREVGIVVNAYFFKTNPNLWCGEYRRSRLIPFFKRLIARAILFCYGGEKCLSKEMPKEMAEGQKLRSIPQSAFPNRKNTQN